MSSIRIQYAALLLVAFVVHGGGIVVGKKQDLVRQHYSFCDAEFSSVIQDSCAGAFTGFHNNDRDFLPSVYGEIQANVVSEGKQLLHGR